jgi:hypothetical protein
VGTDGRDREAMITEDYVSLVCREFERLKRLADRAIEQMPSECFFSAPGREDNSVAVIVKHMGGNLLSRWTDFLASDGEKPGRARDTEFVILKDDTRETLLDRWEQGWCALFSALKPLKTDDVSRVVTIRGEPLSVLQAINRQLTHYAYHVGQIVYVAKHYSGDKWNSLSIPRGQSAQFNLSPTKYVP